MDGTPPLRTAFAFANPRRPLAAAVARGEAPDSTLLGQNHLAEHGIESWIHDPLLTRRDLRATALNRAAWNLREVVLPWEVGAAQVVFTPLANLLPLVARARPGLGVVAFNYGLNQIHRRSSPARRRLLRESLRSASRLVCFGNTQREQLAEWGVLPDERMETLVLPVDERWWSPLEAPPREQPLVLTVGKDLGRDFATFAAAVEPLDVAAELLTLPRNLEGVRLPPNARARMVEPRELREEYAAAACVVVPQHEDDFAYGADGGLTALLEAMAMAKPVVATERSIFRDYVEPGVDALLVPPKDPTALREAIERVLGDPELARRLGAAGRARVERAHTTRGFAARLAPLLHAAGPAGR